MKKTITLALLIGISAFTACKKKETTTEEPAPTPAPVVFGDGFKMEDNLNTTAISDSSRCLLGSTGGLGFQIYGYRGEYPNVQIVFNAKQVQTKTYPVDSLNISACYIYFGTINQYKPAKGSITISALSSTKLSGTFVFTVTPGSLANETRTLVTGTFNNIKIK